jgi:hypothetical protein
VKQKLSAVWYVFLTIPMVTNMWDKERMTRIWEIFSQITTDMVFQNAVAIAVVIGLSKALKKAWPVLNWSWLSLFAEKGSAKDSGTNIQFLPAKIKYFGLLFVVILGINLPLLAQLEEQLFRQGTRSWSHGVVLSLFFGLVHCLVGVSLGIGLAQSIVGLWLTHQYFVGGIELATAHHTTYNLILVSILFVLLLLMHIAGSFDDNPDETHGSTPLSAEH